jgi:hypothetical protein
MAATDFASGCGVWQLALDDERVVIAGGLISTSTRRKGLSVSGLRQHH